MLLLFIFYRSCILALVLAKPVCKERNYADIEDMMIQYIDDWCSLNDPWKYFTEKADMLWDGVEVGV